MPAPRPSHIEDDASPHFTSRFVLLHFVSSQSGVEIPENEWFVEEDAAMAEENALTAEDVAEMLRVSKNSVYRLADEGELPSYRIGRKLRFTSRDVEEYLTAAHAARVCSPTAPSSPGVPACSSPAETFPLVGLDGPVLAGDDLAADVLAGEFASAGLPVRRARASSYTGLVNLYAGTADAALVHLYDRKSNSYNVPYVQRLVPGTSVIVFRLLKRKQGLIVARGNPKRLSSWGSLLRGGVRLANRKRGSGSRVLLDEKLVSLAARSDGIEGYGRELEGADEAVSLVDSGMADVAVGMEADADRFAKVEFVGLQTECLDAVVVKNERTLHLVRALRSAPGSRRLAADLSRIAPCDTSCLGAIVYEC